MKYTGKASTKKGAKQNAAQAMLAFVQNASQNENQMQIATVVADPPDKTFRTYRELKHSDIKPITIRIRDRHNFFLRLPDADRREAYRLLRSNTAAIGSSKDIVDLVCKALRLDYEIKDIPGHIQRNKMFVLTGDFDCVIADKEPDLYERIIKYFGRMLSWNWSAVELTGENAIVMIKSLFKYSVLIFLVSVRIKYYFYVQ